MSAITVLRSFLPALRRGTVRVLMIAVLIAAVVSSHATSGATSAHASSAAADPAPRSVGAGPARDGTIRPCLAVDEDGSRHCGPPCECHGTPPVCLIVRAATPSLATPAAGAVGRLVASPAHSCTPSGWREASAREPCLHTLGICRT